MRNNDAYAWTQHYNVDRAYGVNGLNQIMTAGLATFGYDARGNLTSSNGQSYGYNSDNMMTSAPNGTTMAWDPLGRLAQTVGAGVTTRFAYDGINLIAEYDASNTLLRRYVHGPGTDDPIVWYEGTGTTDRRFLMADERGSIVSVTNSDGTTRAINTYDEYGIPASTNLGRFQYTGQTWLPEAGLYHYKARMYSPTLGRFMQTDPIGYADGMNWYAYVSGDPVNFRDPLGEQRRNGGDRGPGERNWQSNADSAGGRADQKTSLRQRQVGDRTIFERREGQTGRWRAIPERTFLRLGGRIILRFVPIVGWIALANDIYQASGCLGRDIECYGDVLLNGNFQSDQFESNSRIRDIDDQSLRMLQFENVEN